MPIKVVIADDPEVVRRGLVSLLAGSEVKIVGEAASGDEAVKLTKKMKPDVVAKIYLESTKLDASLRGEADTRRKPPESTSNVMLNINLPEGYAKKVQEKSDIIEGQLIEDADA